MKALLCGSRACHYRRGDVRGIEDGGRPVSEYDDGLGTLGGAFVARVGIRLSLMESIVVV